jgi:hypothetical protein
MTPSKKIQQFVVQKAFEKWADSNKTFIEDIQNLCHEMMMFEIKYGTKILYEIDKTPPSKGRESEKEFVDILKK